MFQKIAILIKNGKTFTITSHVNPDGDSIGSEVALFYYLRNLGKNVSIINCSETPLNYRFLDKNGIIEQFREDKHEGRLKNSDVIFILDTNEYSRLKTMAPYIKQSSAVKVCIDHHLGLNTNGFDHYITDTDSPATGEMLFKFFTNNGNDSLDAETSIALYTAIMTDTGSFKFPRTDSETHNIAAKLIEWGADPFEIYSEVYNRSSIGRLKLLSRFLGSLTFAHDNKVIYAFVCLKDFEETGTNQYDTEGFIHHMMSIDTVQVGIIFTETRSGVKISFRSKGDIYVNELAKEFGGGGHKNAAGSFISGKMDMSELALQVVEKVENFIK